MIRDATAEDWPTTWPTTWPIVADAVVEQETFAYDPEMTEGEARAMWMVAAPGRTTVAVERGVVVGTANAHANRPGPGRHVASGSFMVARTARGRRAAVRRPRFRRHGHGPRRVRLPTRGRVGLHVMFKTLP